MPDHLCTGAECPVCMPRFIGPIFHAPPIGRVTFGASDASTFTAERPRGNTAPLFQLTPPLQPYPRPSTTIIIMDLAVEVVLVHQRSDTQVWGFPGGGQEVGESLLQCAFREAREETGLDIGIRSLVCIDSAPEHATCAYQDGNVIQYCNFTFLAHAVGGTLQRSPESLAFQWVKVDALPEPFSAAHRWRLEQALAFTHERGVVIR